jgi:hypothetical protein
LTEEAMGSAPARKSPKKKAATLPSKAISRLNLARNFLHAASIEFQHPKSGKKVALNSDLPAELSTFLEQLTHLR